VWLDIPARHDGIVAGFLLAALVGGICVQTSMKGRDASPHTGTDAAGR